MPQHPQSARFRRILREVDLREALQLWGAEHDGAGPTKADWSARRDPERRWPRSEHVIEAARRIAPAYGVRVERWCRHDGCEQFQRRLLAEVKAMDIPGVSFAPWVRTDYCADCAHGSGCGEPDMSPWEFALVEVGSLRIPTARDRQATGSELSKHGQNRQMVTGGAPHAATFGAGRPNLPELIRRDR